jgi:hypothetical protein
MKTIKKIRNWHRLLIRLIRAELAKAAPLPHHD